MNPFAPFPADPLAALPSVLALRDLRRRVRRAAASGADEGLERRLLRLDPLAALRALRAATVPLYGSAPVNWTVDSIALATGHAVLRRVLDVQAIDGGDSAAVRRLWLHSIATALAARSLAEQSGLLEPEHAYLVGLLHDLPRWLDLLRGEDAAPQATWATWLDHWQVPPAMAALLHSVHADPGGASPPAAPVDASSLLRAAELLAELADFEHPPSTGAAAALPLDALDKAQFVAAQRLRREVEATLAEVGLDFAAPEPTPLPPGHAFDPTLDCLFDPAPISAPDVVLSLLGCMRWSSSQSIIAASTATALRHLDADRAFYVTWIRPQGRLHVRAKTDLSSRRVRERAVVANAQEAGLLALALEQERPVAIPRPVDGAPGLLRHLGTDQLLAIPINRNLATPAFLLVDRLLSTRSMDSAPQAQSATTLGMTVSLLHENLLLRRRQQRAQKFAVTDPLTRLCNRRQGVGALDQELARSVRGERSLTVLMLDLDDFKKLNDQFGHLQGDLALRTTADVLRRTLRRGDTICRYGGEEFLVVLPDTTAEDASILAARLFVAIEAAGTGIGLPTTASIGLATARADDTVESLLARADRALYASKALGRNRFSVDVEPD